MQRNARAAARGDYQGKGYQFLGSRVYSAIGGAGRDEGIERLAGLVAYGTALMAGAASRLAWRGSMGSLDLVRSRFVCPAARLARIDAVILFVYHDNPPVGSFPNPSDDPAIDAAIL